MVEVNGELELIRKKSRPAAINTLKLKITFFSARYIYSFHCNGMLCADVHKIGDLKTPPLNYGQMIADGATPLIDRRCKVIVVANAPKYSVNSH